MSDAEFAEQTHYRARRLKPTMCAIGLVGGTVLVAQAFVETSESPVFRLGSLILGLAWAAYMFFWATRNGVHTEAEGVRLAGSFGTRRLAWREIDRFQVVPSRRLDRLELVTTAGRTVRLPSVAQGPMEWEDGWTADAAARLNAHLAWAKARSG